MPAISSVVITVDVRRKVQCDKYYSMAGSIVFGDGTSTYPAGGIPVTKGQLGFRNTLRGLYFNDESSGDGYVYKFSLANLTVRIYQMGASLSSPLTEVSGAYVPAASTTLQFEAEGY
jgi:hypothetical protein